MGIDPPPPPGTPLVEVVRYYTETARLAVPGWDLELIPIAGKNPRVNGAGWQLCASSDPAVVLDQLARLGGRADGLGALMNRHIAFDVDNRPAVPTGLMSIFEEGLASPTHPDRCHYLFHTPEGVKYGGSKTKLDPAFGVTAKWGEVKAWNSQVRIWSPNSDGTHVALRPAPMPELPIVLGGLLLPPLSPGDMASAGEVEDFFLEHTREDRPSYLAGDIDRMVEGAKSKSKYEAMRDRQIPLVTSAAAGYYSARRAYDELLEAYRALCDADGDWDAEREPKFMVAWRGAVGKALRDPEMIASIEEKRTRTSYVTWDPEHDEEDRELAEWLEEWQYKLAGETPPLKPTAVADPSLLTARSVDDDEPTTASSDHDDEAGEASDEPADDEEMSEYDKIIAVARKKGYTTERVLRLAADEDGKAEWRRVKGHGDIVAVDLVLEDLGAETPPTRMLVREGLGLMYDASIINLIGDKGHGKSWVLAWEALLQVRLGRHVMWLDWEMSRVKVGRRFAQLGATTAELKGLLHYVPMHGESVDGAMKELATLPIDSLVVIDSVSHALAAEGVMLGSGDENEASHYGGWVSRVAPLKGRGIAVALVEHTGHTNQHRSRGTAAKGQAVDSELSFAIVERWSRTSPGWAALTCRKDRDGFLEVDEALWGAFFEPDSDGLGGLTVELRELTFGERVLAARAAMDPSARERAVEDARRDDAKADIKDAIEKLMADGEARSQAEIARSVPGVERVIREAIKELVDAGLMDYPGARVGATAKVVWVGS